MLAKGLGIWALDIPRTERISRPLKRYFLEAGIGGLILSFSCSII
jgi:hypothetical protein